MLDYEILEIDPGSPLWQELLDAAPAIDEPIQRHLQLEIESAHSNHILAAISVGQPVGVLRLVVQRIGEDEERPPVIFKGKTLVEAKVISFGVLPQLRSQGIGRALQERAAALAREKGCYQLRSRSRYSAQANHHLKISMGCGIQPSLKDDSVYFILVL
jgi:GNAT superfamily N-acetyltransferase